MTQAIAITGFGHVSAGQDPKKLTAKALFGHPYKPFGRMDYFSKLGLAGIFKAMTDAGRRDWQDKRNIGLVASTRFGCLGTDRDYFATVKPDHGMAASPALFAYTLPNCFLGEAAILLGLTGEGFIISDDDSTGMAGLSMAMTALLGDNSVEAMVCGICDTPQPGQSEGPASAFEGALFMVLENMGHNSRNNYGTLEFDSSGTIIYNQETVGDIVELAANALKGKKP
jgi:3-oxoacyl-[acyl-carrier-protein] synthase II